MDTRRLDKFYPQEERDINPDYIAGLAVTRFMRSLEVHAVYRGLDMWVEFSEKRKGFSSNMAQLLGLAGSSLLRIMEGKRGITLRTLAKIAKEAHPGRRIRLRLVVEVAPETPEEKMLKD